jgi:LRR receptor-like serine/threonine-protein kinase FLS2
MMNNGLCGAPRLQVPPCKTYAPRGATVTLVFLLELILPLIAATMAALYIFIWLRCPNKNVRPILANTWFTHQELEQAIDGFGEGNLLGRGSFGSVYKGTLSDGMIVAIKVFDAENEVSCRGFEVEREVMCHACHPNIITIFYSSNHANFKALVIEYMVNGSLEKWLHTYNYSLDILQRLDIMIDTASAVEHLHSGSSWIIVHGDLKPSNILLDEDMIARLSDFSIAQVLKPDGQQNSSGPSLFLGTIGYVAPGNASAS